MPESGTVHLHPTNPLAAVLEEAADVLDLTFDQLRTLAVAHQTGSELSAARTLGREQSSVRKQLNTLNELAQRLIGESLIVKQGRGQALLFTPTGEAIAELAAHTLHTWSGEVQSSRRRVGTTITVGSTEFTIRFLGEIWPAVREKFERTGVELKIVHVRTRDFWSKLDAKAVDLICGSFATEKGREPALDYDFIEWHREPVALLTNLSVRELSDRPVSYTKLPELPLLAPTAGLLADFLRRWYGQEYRTTLRVIADIDALNYGLNLLNSDLLHGCLLTTHAVAEAVIEGRLAGGDRLRTVPLADDYRPSLELVTGILGRRNERDRFSNTHPLNVLWNQFRLSSPTQR